MSDTPDIRNRITEVRKMRLGDVAQCPFNWKHHPESQGKAFDGVVREIGWMGVPLAYHSEKVGGLAWADGNMRGKRLPDHVADVGLTDLTDEEVKYALLTYDPIAAMAEANREVLGALLQSVQSDEEGVQALLSDLAEREGVVFGGNGQPPEPPEPQIDQAEELQAKWRVKSGDVWQAGEHFVICGDCREAETWERLLSAAGVEKVNGIFTSPPYAEQRKQQYGGVPVGEYVEWWEAVQANVRANLAGDGSFFLNIKPHAREAQRSLYVIDLMIAMVRQWKWLFVDEFCWLRNAIPQKVTYRFKNNFEPVFWFALNGEYKFRPDDVRHLSNKVPVALGPGAGNTNAARRQGMGYGAVEHTYCEPGMAYPSNVLDFRGGGGIVGHPAAFPVALPDFFIRAYSDPGDVWLDPFLGSGTTICAAHQNDRRGLGFEKLEKYVSVTLERLGGLNLDPQRIG